MQRPSGRGTPIVIIAAVRATPTRSLTLSGTIICASQKETKKKEIRKVLSIRLFAPSLF
jgi:hypothetical protein